MSRCQIAQQLTKPHVICNQLDGNLREINIDILYLDQWWNRRVSGTRIPALQLPLA